MAADSSSVEVASTDASSVEATVAAVLAECAHLRNIAPIGGLNLHASCYTSNESSKDVCTSGDVEEERVLLRCFASADDLG